MKMAQEGFARTRWNEPVGSHCSGTFSCGQARATSTYPYLREGTKTSADDMQGLYGTHAHTALVLAHTVADSAVFPR